MRYGSLFSGAGGLDRAIEQVFEAECAWQCEYDAAASKVLATHWPDVPNLHDVTKVDWSTVEPVDIMCGGYPCQPFSAAGQRKGTDDDRHLWPYFAEAIRRVRPRFVVLENVAGHRSMGFDSVLGDLATLGYDAQWCSIRASDVGAPHRRERLFVLATDTTRDGWTCVDDSASGTPARGGRVRLVSGSAWRGAESVKLLPTPRRSDGDGGPNPLSRAERMDDVETRVIRCAGQWGQYETGLSHWESLTQPMPSPTEESLLGNVRLNPAFTEWMMGWPDGWVTAVKGLSRNDQLRIIGNGVVTLQAVAALRWLLSVCEVAA